MDSPHLDPEAENQLKKYREEQRRRHAQVARENTADANSSQPYHPSPILHTTPSYPTPSAPPMDDNGRNLYPSLSSHNTEENLKKSQEEDDERLARMLQQEEERSASPASPQVNSFAGYNIPSPTVRETPDTDEDEQLALALQESEQFQQDQPPPQNEPAAQTQPEGQGGFLSTLGNIGRGLYNVYNAYSQAHQQAQIDAEQQSQQQVRQYRENQSELAQHRQQLDSDEALARRMQEEEEAEAHYEERQQGRSLRQPPIQFVYRHPPAQSHLSPFGYDSDDDDRMHDVPPPNHPLIALSSIFRGTGAAPDEPLFLHLQELMRETRHPAMRPALPRHRYVFPRSAFSAQGVEELPPDLLNMMQGQTDTSYESLLELAERMQPVSRGASNDQIDQLPTRTFTAGSMPAEHSKCGICLADYEPGEELTSLPCLHSFHKECISHWLGINKICPVCRVEIAGAGGAQ